MVSRRVAVLAGALAAAAAAVVVGGVTFGSSLRSHAVRSATAIGPSYVYGDGQRVYVHAAADRTRAPWLLYIHGGYWKYGAGNTPDATRWAVHEERRGFQVFAIDYGLAPAVHWPTQMGEALTATAWIRAHAARFGIDPTRGVVVGQSAGGQLAAITAMSGGFRGAVVLSGAVDPVGALTAPNAELRLAARQLVGCAPASCPLQWHDSEADAHVHGDLPPFLIISSRHDHVVPVSMAIGLYRTLRDGHHPARLVLLPGHDHAILDLPQAVHDTDAFLDRVADVAKV